MKKRKNAYSRFEDPLPYPLEDSPKNGIQIYRIPDSEKGKVLHGIYPFEGCPALDEVMVDLHLEREFAVGKFLVVRQSGLNYLVSPFFFKGGGTVIDWAYPLK